MSKFTQFLVYCCFLPVTYFSQTTNFSWARQFTGSGIETGNAIATDASGNVYTAGDFGAFADFDPGAGTAYLTPNANNNVYVSKLNYDGTFGWVKQLGGTNSVYAESIALDLSGNVYVTGEFLGTADLDPGAGTYTVAHTAGNMYIVKLNSSGSFLWARQFGGVNGMSLSIKTDAASVYVTGYFSNSGDFDPGAGLTTLASAGQEDAFILKLDASGTYLWANRMGGTGADISVGIAPDLSGNVYTTGYFENTVDFDPGATNFSVTASGNTDAYVHKLDASGNYVWVKTFGGMFASVFTGGISVDGSNNIYTAGGFSGAADFDPNAGVLTLNSAFSTDAYINKLDPSGIMIWTKVMGSASAGDVVKSIFVNQYRDVYISGDFAGAPDFDPGAGVYTITSVGATDIYVCKLDSMGLFRWAKSAGGPASEVGSALAVDNSENVLVTGYFQGTADFNPSSSVFTLTAGGGTDAYVWKLCQTPEQPTSVSGNTLQCSGGPATYSVLSVKSATAYGWTFPVGWVGSGTSTLITATAGSTSGLVLVTANNGCGSSSPLSLSVTVNISPTVSANSGTICAGGSFSIIPGGAASYSFSSGSLVSPLQTTSYSVTGTSSEGCAGVSTAVATVTVYAVPVISVTSGSICTGQTFTIQPSGAGTYTIQGGSSSVSPAINTTYSVTGTSLQGCISSNTAVSNVSVFATPVITAGSGTTCAGQSFTLIPGGASTYTVSQGSFTVSPTATTAYSISGTSSAGCSSTVSAVAVITVFALPQLSVNAGTLCAGDTFTLMPSGATTYTFSGGQAIVSPTATTTYSIIGTDIYGCVSGSPALSTVTVYALPVITSNSGSVCAGNSFTILPGGASSYTISGGNTVVSPLITTNYSVSGTNIYGCNSSAPAVITVTVISAPIPAISVNSGSICFGKSFTMSPSGAFTYTISGGSPVVSPQVTSSYSVTGTSSAGCISTQAAISTVVVNTLPLVQITPNGIELCRGEVISLTATGATTYTWSNGDNGSVLVISPSVTAQYSLTGEAANGCSNNAVIAVTVSECLSEKEAGQIQNLIAVFPNPAHDLVEVKFAFDGQKDLVISNSFGQVIVATTSYERSEKIDLSSFGKGVYYLKVSSGSDSKNFKVLIE